MPPTGPPVQAAVAVSGWEEGLEEKRGSLVTKPVLFEDLSWVLNAICQAIAKCPLFCVHRYVLLCTEVCSFET